MDDLYTQFLLRNDLDDIWFRHGPCASKKRMTIPEKLVGVKIDGIFIPLNSSVKNGRLLRNEILISSLEAKRELDRWIKMYQGATIEPDDAVMLTEQLYQVVFAKLLWPLEYATIEGQLQLEEFLPIATEMEKMVDEFVACIDKFIHGLDAHEQGVQYRLEQTKEHDRIATEEWARNAPLEVRGSARIRDDGWLFGGKKLEIYANVRSTVTSGQVNAQHMVNNLLANQSASRERVQGHMALLKQLKQGVGAIVDGYFKRWQTCLKNNYKSYRTIFWYIVWADEDSMIGNIDLADTVWDVYCMLENPKEIPAMIAYLNYYEFDFEDTIGQYVYNEFINHYLKTNEVLDDIGLQLYLAYYKKSTLAECNVFFNRFRRTVQKTGRKTMEISYEQLRDIYETQKDEIVSKWKKSIDNFPGISYAQREAMMNIIWYHYYDVMHDRVNRDKYDSEGKVVEIPVFQY